MGGAFENSVGTPLNIACTPGIGAVAANSSSAFNAQTVIANGVREYPADTCSHAAVEAPVDRGHSGLDRPMANFRYRVPFSQLSRDYTVKRAREISKVAGGHYLGLTKFVLVNLKTLAPHIQTPSVRVPPVHPSLTN